MERFIEVDPTRCTGCRTCELVCSLGHVGACDPVRSAIRVRRRERDGLVTCAPVVCQQCERPLCVETCPTGALSRGTDPVGIRVDADRCTGCELCVEACVIGGLALDPETGGAISCDLCGGSALCVPACHARCLRELAGSGEDRRLGLDRLSVLLEQAGLGRAVRTAGGA